MKRGGFVLKLQNSKLKPLNYEQNPEQREIEEYARNEYNQIKG